jgi:cytochrome o ubiquinol oxidase operon protein cyoD
MKPDFIVSERASGRDVAPGYTHDDEEPDVAADARSYVIGLTLAILLTAASFWAARTQFIYQPGIQAAMVTLAIAQMGVHLVFFLHITTSPDNTNNVLALAFGVMIVCFVVFGSLWIMTHLSHMTVSMDQLMRMQR